MDRAVFRADEDAVRAVAGAHEEERPRVARLAFVEAPEPVGPFKFGKGRDDFDVERPLVDFGGGAIGEQSQEDAASSSANLDLMQHLMGSSRLAAIVAAAGPQRD